MEEPDLSEDSSGCTYCTLDPPPDGILHIPPPPLPPFLKHAADYYEQTAGVSSSDDSAGHLDPANPCKHACDWRDQGVRYHEAPHQGMFYVKCFYA